MAIDAEQRVVVVGEALVDLVMPEGAAIDAVLGGAPFNTARALARLGAVVSFVGTLSNDRFGGALFSALARDGVDTASVERTDHPTTLAAAELSPTGSAQYRFYIDGTSACLLDRDRLDSLPAWMFTGGLALVLHPLATRVEAMVASLAPSTRLMLDINCRPRVITDQAAYRARVERVAARADVVKLSDEDLDYLYPDLDNDAALERLVGLGSRVVVLTSGGDEVVARTATAAIRVPVPPVEIVDTIGAGDTFDAGLLAHWVVNHAAFDPDDVDSVADAVAMGISAASVVVGRRGADPPHIADLPPTASRSGQ